VGVKSSPFMRMRIGKLGASSSFLKGANYIVLSQENFCTVDSAEGIRTWDLSKGELRYRMSLSLMPASSNSLG
jgi:hypothetical protein